MVAATPASEWTNDPVPGVSSTDVPSGRFGSFDRPKVDQLLQDMDASTHAMATSTAKSTLHSSHVEAFRILFELDKGMSSAFPRDTEDILTDYYPALLDKCPLPVIVNTVITKLADIYKNT